MSKVVATRNVRFIGPPKKSMKSAQNYLAQNPAANQRKCGPLPVVCFNPVNDPQNDVHHSAAHCEKPHKSKNSEKRQRRLIAVLLRRKTDACEKRNKRKDQAAEENHNVDHVPR